MTGKAHDEHDRGRGADQALRPDRGAARRRSGGRVRAPVLALLGPNGAGKTTAVRMLATLAASRTPGRPGSAGTTWSRDAVQVRQLIALTGQFASVDDELTGTENLMMIGRLLGLPPGTARARAAELLERFELTDAAGPGVPRPTRAACTAGWTWRPAWSASPGCCSWTSRPPGSTRAAGRTSVGFHDPPPWSRTGSPCCLPPSTWRRPTSWPTGSR